MGKLLKVRKPKIRVTQKGIKMSAPSARIGGKAGINLSKTGVSASARTPLGTVNTGKFNPMKQTRKKKPGCFGILLLIFIVVLTILIIL
jgi:hypothetical protein